MLAVEYNVNAREVSAVYIVYGQTRQAVKGLRSAVLKVTPYLLL